MLWFWILLYCCPDYGAAAWRYKGAERPQVWSLGAGADDQQEGPLVWPESYEAPKHNYYTKRQAEAHRVRGSEAKRLSRKRRYITLLLTPNLTKPDTTLVSPDLKSTDISIDGQKREPVFRDRCHCFQCNTSVSSYETNHYENILYNKPTYASSFLNYNHTPCTVNNGILNPSGHQPLFFLSGSGDPLPWLIIDMLYVVTFNHFFLQQTYEGDTIRSERLLGVDVLADGRVIYQFPRYTQSHEASRFSRKMKINLTEPETARYITFQKRDDDIGKNERNSRLGMVNIEIWVCKPGTYGFYGILCKPCPNVCIYACNNHFGCDKVVYNVAAKKDATVISWGQIHESTGSEVHTVDVRLAGKLPTNCFQYKTVFSYRQVLYFVDLEATFRIVSVAITSRVTDGGSETLAKFFVLVFYATHYTAKIYLSDEDINDQLCYYQEDAVPPRTRMVFPCVKSRFGKQIMVGSAGILGFCEFEAFGYRAYEIAAGGRCDDTTQYLVCEETTPYDLITHGFCENRVCKKGILSSCTNDDECFGKTCELGKCKVKLNERCHIKVDVCVKTAFCHDGKCGNKLGHANVCFPGSDESKCPRDSYCDIFRRCGLPPGQKCQDTQQCIAGALCKQGICTCNLNVSTQNDTHCTPFPLRIGTHCVRFAEAACRVGICPEGRSQCSCQDNELINYHDFTCRLNAGINCKTDLDCGYRMTCRNEVCYITAGNKCLYNEEYCESGHSCQEGICKSGVAQGCGSGNTLCPRGSSCVNGYCKLNLGEDCKDNIGGCASGFCSPGDRKCRIEVLKKCTSQTARFCAIGSSCINGACRRTVGETCFRQEECRAGLHCLSRTGSSDFIERCRVKMGDNGCAEDNHCETNTVCDVTTHCGIPEGGDCRQAGSYCAGGGRCVSGKCRCEEKAGGTQCSLGKGRLGGGCRPPGGSEPPCDDPWALCRQDVCHCADNFVVEISHCRLRPGGHCTANSNCTKKAICDEGVCSLKVGESCEGELAGYCRKGSICDEDAICRINLHQSCANHTTGCRINTTCDALRRCKRGPGKYCKDDADCIHGSQCTNQTSKAFSVCECIQDVSTFISDTCVPLQGLAGGKCLKDGTCEAANTVCDKDTGLCQCKQGFSVQPRTLTCGKALGESCNTDEECSDNSICDPEARKCRIPVGDACDGNRKDYCVTGSLCDKDDICRMQRKGKCFDNDAVCKIGTFCDVIDQCSVGQGDSCIAGIVDPCVAGASCVDSVCVCEPGVSIANGPLCDPAKGLYGSSCEVDCAVKNSKCVDGKCVCNTDFEPDQHFNCVSMIVVQGPKRTVSLTILVTALIAALAAIAVIVILAQRRRHAKEQDSREHSPGTRSRKATDAVEEQGSMASSDERRDSSAFSDAASDNPLASTSNVSEHSGTTAAVSDISDHSDVTTSVFDMPEHSDVTSTVSDMPEHSDATSTVSDMPEHSDATDVSEVH